MSDPGHGRLLRRVTAAALGVALALTAIKATAWLLTGSVTMLGAMLDSLLDAFASLLNLIAVRHALTPADHEHRFGHGKAEPLAGLGQAAFIAGSSLMIFFESGQRLWQPAPLAHEWLGIGVAAFSALATLALVTFQKRVIARTGSMAVGADSLHYQGDMAMNGAIVVALLLSSQFGLTWADPVFAIAIALYMLKAVYGIAAQALDHLMDRELPDAARTRIRELALAHPEARAVHDMRTRAAGNASFIQFHLELDGDLTLNRAHVIADEIEASIRAEFPGAEIIIHEDPAGLEEAEQGFTAH